MKFGYREASSLILTALKKAPVKETYSYLVLTLQRSAKNSFMPGGYVFPGGATHEADSSEKWIKFFSQSVLKDHDNMELKEVPAIIQSQNSTIPKLLSLKITAIRETFEETGILLCYPNTNKSTESSYFVSSISSENLSDWRSKIQQDPSEFINMCQNYGFCPNIQSLYLWSNWLTPTTKKKRFDTAFFIACLEEIPVAMPDETEVVKLLWSTPDDLLNLYKKKNIWLPPPQLYETSRLIKHQNYHSLIKFAFDRRKEGCQRWMPEYFKTLDGLVSILPGDDMYNVVDFSTPKEPSTVKFTTKEFRSQAKTLHRIEFVNDCFPKILTENYKPPNNHILPLNT